jgi:hypothetical protein
MASSHTKPELFREHWSDRLIRWIDTGPLPQWAFYGLLFISGGLIMNLASWFQSVNPWLAIQPHYFLAGYWITAYLLANHFLINSAKTALFDIRDSLDLSEDSFQQRLFQFTHLPRVVGNIGFVLGILIGIGITLYMATLTQRFAIPTPYIIATGLIGFGFFVLALMRAYHQLKIVVSLFESIESIDLYDLQSVYALALFPVRVVVVIILTLWVNPAFILFPTFFADPVIRFLWALLTISSSAIAILPLQGVIHRLKTEKNALLKENAQQLTSAREELYRRLRSDELENVEELEKGINALFAFRSSIEGISTLPWKAETLRWLVTVLLLPLGLLIIQFLLQQYFGL